MNKLFRRPSFNMSCLCYPQSHSCVRRLWLRAQLSFQFLQNSLSSHCQINNRKKTSNSIVHKKYLFPKTDFLPPFLNEMAELGNLVLVSCIIDFKLGVSPANFIISTKVLMATPQGRRLGYHTHPSKICNFDLDC